MPRRRTIVEHDVHSQLAEAVRASRQPVAALARALHCDRTTLYKWLDGTNAIPREQLARLCELIHLPDNQRRAQLAQRGYAAPDAPPLHTLPALHQLRAPTRDFVGRALEISQIVAALTSTGSDGAVAAICGVRGMGGVGKTELAYAAAQQLARAFPDGQIVLKLRGAGSAPVSPTQVIQAALRAFEPDAQLPDDLDALQGRYRSWLAGKRVLVLADDVADTAQVRPLLPPLGSALLITSRQRFALSGTINIDLDVLAAAAAETLLLAICPRIGTAARRLAELCGFLPLALRISAGLLASDDSYPTARYLGQLETARLAYLRDPQRPNDPQASVEASLALSYTALDSAAQAALATLGVFPASFDLDAAIAVLQTGDTDVALLLLSQLRWRNLIEWNAHNERYQLHDLVRDFALGRLVELSPAHQRHALYFLQIAEHDAPLRATRHSPWCVLIERERDNMAAALVWLKQSDARELSLRLACALGPFWLAYDVIKDGIAALQAALASSPPHVEQLRARALFHAGMLARVQGQLDVAQRSFAESRQLMQWLEEQEQYAETTFQLGLVLADQGEKQAARSYFEESLVHFRQCEQQARVATVLSSLGRIALDGGDYARAQQYFAESYTLMRAADDVEELAWLLVNMARNASIQGDDLGALRAIDEAIQHFRALDHSQGMAWAVLRRGRILAELRRYHDARVALAESLTFFERLDNAVGCAMAHQMLAETMLTQRDEEAARYHTRCSLRIYHAQHNLAGVGLTLILAALLVAPQDALQAAPLLGAADVALEGTGVALHAPEYALYNNAHIAVREQLSETVFAAMWQQGRALPIDEVVISALAIEQLAIGA